MKRARLFLRTQYCRCDLWDYLDGKTPGAFTGEYLRPYEWSVERENELLAARSGHPEKKEPEM